MKTATSLSDYHEIFSAFSGIDKEMISSYKLPEDKLLSEEEKKKIFSGMDLKGYNIMPLLKVKIKDNNFLILGSDINQFFVCILDNKGNSIGKTVDFNAIHPNNKGDFAFTGFEINSDGLILDSKGDFLVPETKKIAFTESGLKEE